MITYFIYLKASCNVHTVHKKQSHKLSCFSLFHFQVIGSTSTLDGAVAACLLKFGDKEGKY